MVKCIILYDDKLVITFNFKNEPVTVPTSDELLAIEGSSDIEAFASPWKKRIPFRYPFFMDALISRVAHATSLIS